MINFIIMTNHLFLGFCDDDFKKKQTYYETHKDELKKKFKAYYNKKKNEVISFSNFINAEKK